MAKRLYKNKRTLIALILIAITTVGVATYIKFSQNPPKTEQQKLQEEEKKSGTPDPKTSNESYQRQSQEQPGKDNVNTGGTQPPKQAANIYISSASQSGNNVYISAIVEGQTTGTCTLTLKKAGSQTITRTAPVGIATSYYGCQGFTIERAAFSASGEWDAIVSFQNANASAQSGTQKVNIQ